MTSARDACAPRPPARRARPLRASPAPRALTRATRTTHHESVFRRCTSCAKLAPLRVSRARLSVSNKTQRAHSGRSARLAERGARCAHANTRCTNVVSARLVLRALCAPRHSGARRAPRARRARQRRQNDAASSRACRFASRRRLLSSNFRSHTYAFFFLCCGRYAWRRYCVHA